MGWLMRYMHSTGASFFSLLSTCTCIELLCMDRIEVLESSLVNRHGDICGVDGGRLCRIFIALG